MIFMHNKYSSRLFKKELAHLNLETETSKICWFCFSFSSVFLILVEIFSLVLHSNGPCTYTTRQKGYILTYICKIISLVKLPLKKNENVFVT